ncbi:MAG: hypothetical protein HONBIEJF_02887 [Fimbriimonadaceae bacterium]|nr:hypothetical protein [Fimbriimonadaceae bacterium]
MSLFDLKLWAGVLVTVGLYSVLFKENKFYRFFEHMFLGLAAGWMLVALWTETLKSAWWDNMVGVAAEGTTPGTSGNWAWALLLPIGMMAYFVFSRKHNWMSRIPIGIILGLWSGQQIQVWFERYGPQIANSMKPVIPTTTDALFQPGTTGMETAAAAAVRNEVYASEALNNLIFVITLLCVLSYFLFSFEIKNRLLRNMTVAGRWLLMIGFGAIFGSTVMMRFTLLIDRMYFVWQEWLMQGLLGR